MRPTALSTEVVNRGCSLAGKRKHMIVAFGDDRERACLLQDVGVGCFYSRSYFAMEYVGTITGCPKVGLQLFSAIQPQSENLFDSSLNVFF